MKWSLLGGQYSCDHCHAKMTTPTIVLHDAAGAERHFCCAECLRREMDLESARKETPKRAEQTPEERRAWLAQYLRDMADAVERGPLLADAALHLHRDLARVDTTGEWAAWECTGKCMIHAEWQEIRLKE